MLERVNSRKRAVSTADNAFIGVRDVLIRSERPQTCLKFSAKARKVRFFTLLIETAATCNVTIS